MKSRFLSLCAALITSASFSTTLLVTETGEFGPGSLPSIVGSANSGDTIKFKLTNLFMMIDSPIIIDKDLTIIGASAGSMTISPSNAIDKLFDIQNNATVYLKDLHIDNYRNGAISLKTGCTVTLERCQIQYCIGFPGQLGGAIYNGGGDLTLISTSIHNCSADDGAGLYNADGGTATIINSSILNNSANNSGGGIYQTGNNSVVSVRNSTVNDNYGTGLGNGMYIDNGTCNIYNSMFAFNGEGSGEVFGVINSNGYNLILVENGIDPASNWPTATDIGNQDPLIISSGGDGGATFVAKPDYNSPVIDAGDPNFSGLEWDNRLAYRIMDGDRDGNARIDIGAVEYSDFIVYDAGSGITTPNTLPNIIAQIDTTVAEGPYYVDFDLSFGSIAPQQRMTIKREVLIDGFSLPSTYPPGAWQPGQYNLELRGSSIITDEPMIDFQSGSEGSIIRGASILLTNMDQLNRAINISADNIHISGNQIGLTSGGSQSVNRIGVYIDGAKNIKIGGSEERDRNIFNSSGQSIYITNNTSNDNIDVKGNWFGTNTLGTASNGTVTGTGILIEGGDNITIGGSTYVERNIISNTQSGIIIDAIGSKNINIIGNYIGTNKDGNAAINNQTYGIRLNRAEGINIGGENETDQNVISGNASGGILLDGLNTTKNRILNNLIGTDATGLLSISNNFGGILITNGANYNEVGVAGFKNVISGNGSTGININSSDNNSIIGNYIGLDITGMNSLANNGSAINLFEASNTIIGSTNTDGSNYVSGNSSGGNAISINAFGGSLNNIIINNYIGVGVDGTTAIPNDGSGIFLDNNVDSTIIGGLGDSSNTIANSTFGSGIIFSEMSGGNPEKNTVHNNKIYNNANNGISFFGVVQEGVEIPVITTLETDSTLTGSSSPNAYIQIFADSLNQGEILLGTTFSDATGKWSHKLTVPVLPWKTGYLTVLQDSANNTSMFSENVELCFAPLYVVKTVDDSSCGSLRKALIYASENSGPHTITFGISNDTIVALGQYEVLCDTTLTIDATNKNITIQPSGAFWNAANVGSASIFNIGSSNVKIKGLNFNAIVKDQSALRLQSGIFNIAGDSLTIEDVDITGTTTYAIANTGQRLLVDNSTLLDFGTYGIVNVTGTNGSITNCNIGFREGQSPITGNQFVGVVSTSQINIGGDINSEGNTIAYCDSIGIYISGPNSTVEGNLIGINNQEEEAGNKLHGIFISGADSSKIGDGSTSKRNIISGNGLSGITIDQSLSLIHI